MRIQIVMHLVGQLVLIVAPIMVIPFIYSLLWETPAISSLACALLGYLLVEASYILVAPVRPIACATAF